MRGMIGLPGAMLLALTGGAWAAEVTEKVEVKATPAAAWAAIGDFCGIKDWHPVIVGCEIKMDGADKIRTLTAKDGAQFVEKQVAWDNGGKSYTYAILTSPLPLTGYKSTVGVTGYGRNGYHYLDRQLYAECRRQWRRESRRQHLSGRPDRFEDQA